MLNLNNFSRPFKRCSNKPRVYLRHPIIFLIFFLASGFSTSATQLEERSPAGTVLTPNTIHTDNETVPHHSDYRLFLQTTAWTCGPAALRFVLAHYGIEITEDELAKLSGTQENFGTTLLGLKQSTESLGIKAKGQRWNWVRLTQEKNPVLAYISDSHYVVVLASDAETVTFFDPGSGKLTHSKEDFLGIWDGIVLAFPSQEMENPSSTPPLTSVTQKLD